MIKDKASWTAEMTAVFRATETIRPIQQRLFQDIFAAKFLRPQIRLILKSGIFARFALWFMIDRRFPGATDTIVSRIRYIDDCLKGAISEGIEQLVILGAGFDSRAYRFAELSNINVFEVDHPNTRNLKIQKVIHIFGCLPKHVKYVPVDFEKERLFSKLLSTGFDSSRKTLFIWEGVSKYLTKGAVDELLTDVSLNTSKGSSIVFDYLFESMIDKSSGSPLTKRMLDFQLKKGEPFIFGLPEESPEDHIKPKGFSVVKNVPASKIKKMYFHGLTRAKNLHPFWGIIRATV